MPSNPPVNFQQLAQGAVGTTNADYPYSIKGTDLDKNFVYATLDLDDSLITEQTGAGGHLQRRLKIPAVPQGGTFVLGAENGTLAWLETEACEEQ